MAVRLLMCVDGEMYGVLWSQLSPAKATSALEVLSAVAASDTVPRALRILEAFLQVWGNASDHIAAETPHLTHASHSIIDTILPELATPKTEELSRRLMTIRAIESSTLTAAIDLHEALIHTEQTLSAVDDEEVSSERTGALLAPWVVQSAEVLAPPWTA